MLFKQKGVYSFKFTIRENKENDIINKYIESLKKDLSSNNQELKNFNEKLENSLKTLIKFTDWIKDKMQKSKNDVSAACNDYLKVLGYVAVAHSWIKVLEVSYKNYETNKQFYEDKINTAKYLSLIHI